MANGDATRRPAASASADGARVTLGDVAALAGVSTAAASLALRGRPGVADATRQRVVDAAGELGYRMRGSSDGSGSLTIGLLVKSKAGEVVETNAFYGPVVAGINAEAAARDVDLRLDTLLVDDHFDPVEVPRLVQAGDVDGLLVLGAYLSRRSASLLATHPLVLVDGYTEVAGELTTVVTDNVAGAAAATRHLIALGHRDIAVAGTSADAFPSIAERRRGYTLAMAAAGLEPRYVDGPHDDPEGVAAKFTTERGTGPAITAVVAANDEVAIALLRELGTDAPGQVSVVGFDDIEAADLLRPRLDTVAIDKPAMGRLALTVLLHRIRFPDDPPPTVMQPATLVVRESSTPISAPQGDLGASRKAPRS